MTILHREFEWLQGIDPRSLGRTEWELGYVRATDWSHPGFTGFSRYTHIPSVVGSHWRPFITQLQPFSADAAGVTYDTDQLFAVFFGGAGGGGGGAYAGERTPGDTTNPLTFDYPYVVVTTDQAKRESWVVYRAAKVPAGASVTFQFFDTFGNPTLADYTIPSAPYERNLCQYLPAQTIAYDEDNNPYMVVTWSGGGGVPWWEDVSLSIFCASALYVPVPTTLDAAYTARTAHDVERGGIFADRKQADRRRVRATPAPWEPAVPSGLAAFDQATFWLDGVLKANSWLAGSGLNGQISRLGGSIPGWPASIPAPYPLPDPQTASTTSVGVRALRMDIAYFFVTGAASFLVKVKVDGSVVHSASYNASSTGITIAPPALPTPGTTQTVTLEVYKPSGLAHWDDGITVALKISPRVDIPYPFALVAREQTGARLTAPGGYLPGKISDWAPGTANVTRLAAGVTSSAGKASFKPAADGWYQTKTGGGVLMSGGADDFGASDGRQIDRGRTNQPYYISGAGSLSVYTPSPHSIASGGTDLTPTVGNWWEWGTIAFGGAGNWYVTVVCKNVAMLKRGLVAEWSASESTVIHPEGQAFVETLDEGTQLLGVSGVTWAGSATTPPASPVIGDAWVILSPATGAWAGREGQWALWDDIVDDWIYFTPDRYSYLVNALGTDWTWYDGNAWKAKTDPIMTIPVSTAGPITWGLSLRSWSLERTISGSPTATVKWAAA